MPTAAQIAAQRKQLRQEAERAARQRDRARLRELREHLRHASKLKRSRAREVVIACRQARVRLRAQRKAAQARYAAEVAAARERERLASRKSCDAKKLKTASSAVSRVERAKRALLAERSHQEHARVWARKDPLQRPAHKRRGDSLQESDSEVVHNIPHDLLPVWKAVRGRIKSTPRRSRTETFLEWIEEHQGEVQRILDKQIERDVSELVQQEAELRKRVASPRSYRAMSSAALSDVPF